MKKQIKKLNLGKRTISNLKSSEMITLMGGDTSYGTSRYHTCFCGGGNSQNCTRNQNTCPGHNTCYTC